MLSKLLLCTAILLPNGAARAASVTIYSTADSGSGSLREALTAINTAGAASNTVNWVSGLGGTLTLLSDLPGVNYDTTWNLTSSVYDFTIAASTNAMSVNAALTIYNDSIVSTITINEDITGSGSLIKTGDGTLVLSGTNTYTGGTCFNGGTLATNGDDSLGAAGGLLSFDGGALKLLDSFSSYRPVTLNAAGGIFNTNGYTLGLYGTISGTGALTKKGLGTLVLGAANTYAGGTVVSSGTVLAAAAGALGSGAVSVSADGTLELGSYIETVAAFANAGALGLTLQSGVTNLTVTGAANLDGTLHVTYAPQIITEGQTFTPITAGTLTGYFDSVVSPAAVIFTQSNISGGLVLTASLVPFANIADTADQRAVGAALEPLRTAASGDLLYVMQYLYTLEKAQLNSAFDQIGPLSLASMSGLSAGASALRSQALEARALELASGGGSGLSTYGSASRGMDYMDYGDISSARRAVKKEAAKGGSAKGSSSPWGFFAAAGGISGRRLDAKTAGKTGPAYELTSMDFNAGADYSIGGNFSAGLLAGVNSGTADVYSPSKAEVDSVIKRCGAYAAGKAGALRLTLYAGRSQDSFETARTINFSGVSRKAKASPEGRELNLEAGAAWELFEDQRSGSLAPFIKGYYDRLSVDAFTERGADSLNLSVDAFTARSLRSAAGLRYSASVDAGGGAMLRTALDLAWDHEYADGNIGLTSALAESQAFTVYTGQAARDALKFGAVISAGSESGAVSGWLSYKGDMRSRSFAHAASAGATFRF